MASGSFITFEGGEGTGKSTQLRLLAERLRRAGLDVLETREPGGTQGAEIVRHAVLSGRVADYGAFAEALLMNVARDDHLREVIRPALEEGRWVLSDRFHDSTRAYQGASQNVDEKLLDAMEQVVVSETVPDLTIVLDLEPELGLERARARTKAEARLGRDRFEEAELDYHRRIRETFLRRAEAEPGRCVVVPADRTPDEVAAAVWNAVSARLPVPEPQPEGTQDGSERDDNEEAGTERNDRPKGAETSADRAKEKPAEPATKASEARAAPSQGKRKAKAAGAKNG